MRDGQSLLDQLLAFGTGAVTVEQVHRLLGTSGDERIYGLAAAVVGGDAAAALTLLDQADAQGAQMSELVDQLVTYWRDLMAVQVAGDVAANLSVAPNHRATLGEQAKGLSLDAILAGLDILTTTRMRLRDNDHARALVEMALVRLTRLKELVAVGQLAQWLATGQVKAPAGTNPARTATPPEAVKKNARNDAGAVKSAVAAQTTVPVPPAGQGADTLSNNLAVLWEQTLAQVGALLANDLRNAELPAILGPNALVLRFPATYNSSAEYSQRHVAKVEQVLKTLTGKPWSVRIETAVAPATPVETPPEPAPQKPRLTAREEAEKEPLVRRAIDVLGGQIIRADEGFGSAGPAREAGGPEDDEES